MPGRDFSPARHFFSFPKRLGFSLPRRALVAPGEIFQRQPHGLLLAGRQAHGLDIGYVLGLQGPGHGFALRILVALQGGHILHGGAQRVIADASGLGVAVVRLPQFLAFIGLALQPRPHEAHAVVVDGDDIPGGRRQRQPRQHGHCTAHVRPSH